MSLVALSRASKSLRGVVQARRHKLFSSAPKEAASSSELEVAAEERDVTLLQGSHTQTLGEIVRHGPGDAVITLNVGGKEFHTLRSTVNSNAVLADHVARAEANSEITKNGAVFIDRDPEHFGFILKHLQNRMALAPEKNHVSKKSLLKFTKAHMDIPSTQGKVLNELFVEASFYRITELQESLCTKSWYANISGFFGGKAGGTNPFSAGAALFAQLRTGLLAAGAFGGTMLVTLQDDYDWLLKKLGLRDEQTRELPSTEQAASTEEALESPSAPA